jgi:hypothetical protein
MRVMIEDVSRGYYGVLKQKARLAEEVSDYCNVTLGRVYKDLKRKNRKLCKLNSHEGKAGNSIGTHMPISSTDPRVHAY